MHGPVALEHDVVTLIADPSFRETPIGGVLATLCQRYAIALKWHPGFQLAVQDVSDTFRGSAMPHLAARIAQHGVINAAIIGQAALTLEHTPQIWHDWDNYEATLQHLKQLWHVVVQSGTEFKNTPCSA